MTEPADAPTRTEPALDSTTRTDPSDELATTTLLRAAIGPVSSGYYLPLFTRFDAQDRAGLGWNTAAGLATVNWLVFRRMWNAALAYTGITLTLALLVFGIGKLAFHYTPETQWALAGVFALLWVAVPGLLGNALLFRHYRSEMARALAANHSIADAAAMLAAQAPQRQRALVLAVVNAVALAALAALAVWASGFNGLPSAMGLPASAELPATAASGNVAVGRALEAASAPTPAASAPAAAASAPALPASAASAPALPASGPQAVAAAPQALASAPAAQLATAPTAPASAPVAGRTLPTANAPTPPASAPLPAAKAATPAPTATVGAAPVKADKSAMPEKAPVAPAKAVEAAKAGDKADASAREKAEAAKLAPQAALQNSARKEAPSKATDAPRTPSAAPAKPAPKKPAAASAKAPADALAPPGGPAGSYGINVGVFADPNNARNAFVKLSDAGLPAYTQEITGKKGKLTRVRVGPFGALAEAERTADRVRGLGLDALVFQQGEGR